MDLLQRLKEATSHGLTKEDFFRLVDLETKLNEHNKKITEVQSSGALTQSSAAVTLKTESARDMTLEDVVKKQNELKDGFLELRSTFLNKLEEDKQQMKAMLVKAQESILKSVTIQLEEERRAMKDELDQMVQEKVSEIVRKMDENKNTMANKMGQNHNKVMAAITKKGTQGAGKATDSDPKLGTTDEGTQPMQMSKNQLKKQKKLLAKQTDMQIPLQYPHPEQSSYQFQASPPKGFQYPLPSTSPQVCEMPFAAAAAVSTQQQQQKPRRPKPKKQVKQLEPEPQPEVHHHYFHEPEKTEEEKTAEAVKVVVEKIGSAFRQLSN